MQRIIKTTIFISIFLLCGLNAIGQEDNSINTYSPYTLYGIGDISKPGSVTSSAMGGLTIGVRDALSIDYHNPASLSVRDTLSFLFDVGVMQKNTYAKTSTSKTSANNFNFDYFALSFRVAKGLGFAAGVKTYSSIGYDIERRETDPYLIYKVGNILYQHKGEGGINMVFAGAGWQLSKNISIGANFLYYFGSIERYYNILFTTNSVQYSSLYSHNKLRVSKVGFSAGAQYHKQLQNNTSLVVGATFRPKTDLSPKREAYTSTVSYTTDTINYNTEYISNVFVPMEFGIGVTLNKLNKLTIGIDYTYEDWKDFNITGKSNSFIFDTDINQTIRLGVDYVPNAYDIRKPMKRWNYRAGAYFSNTYMICNGERIKDYGVTLGVGIPINRMGAKLNGAVEIGQRGTTSNGLIKESYVGLKFSASIHELWFVKYKYH